MAKNVKKKRKRIRSFKVYSDLNGNPFIRFGGKYLSRELGLNCGDRVELLQVDGAIMLRKFSADELAELEAMKKEKSLLKQLLDLRKRHEQPTNTRLAPTSVTPIISKMMVAERRSTYSVDDEIIDHPEKYKHNHKGAEKI